MVINPSEMCLAQQHEEVSATRLQADRKYVFCLEVVMPQGGSLKPGKFCGYSKE